MSNSVPLWAGAHQAPQSVGFPRQEYWSGLPCSPPRELPNPGIEPMSPTLAGRFFTTEPPEKLLKAKSKGDRRRLIWDWFKEMIASLEQVHGFQRQLLWQSYPSMKHTRASVLGRPRQWRTVFSSHFYSLQTQTQCLVKGSLSINICWKK